MRGNLLAQLQWARAHDEAARVIASRGAITASPFIDHGIDEHHSSTGELMCHAHSDGQPRGALRAVRLRQITMSKRCNQSGGTQD